jgi:hypothetical protein
MGQKTIAEIEDNMTDLRNVIDRVSDRVAKLESCVLAMPAPASAPVEQPAQSGASEGDVVERMRSAAIEGGGNIDWTAALRVALDEALGPVTGPEWSYVDFDVRSNIDGMLSDRRSRLLAPAAPVDPAERVTIKANRLLLNGHEVKHEDVLEYARKFIIADLKSVDQARAAGGWK